MRKIVFTIFVSCISFLNLGKLYSSTISKFYSDQCPEPINIKIDNVTTTGVEVSWQQLGVASEWEVYVTDYGKGIPVNPSPVITVANNPKTEIKGLSPSRSYSVYVRAICSNIFDESGWVKKDFGTLVEGNDICEGAIPLTLNKGKTCVSYFPGSITATANIGELGPVWYEFEATSTNHGIKIEDFGYGVIAAILVYEEGNCDLSEMKPVLLHYVPPLPLPPWPSDYLEGQLVLLKELTIGKKYFIALYGAKTSTEDKSPITAIYRLCLTTWPHTIFVYPMDDDEYTVENIVNNKLFSSGCNQVSNVKYQAGDGEIPKAALAYFDKNNSTFPFDTGIILATHSINDIPGPYARMDKDKLEPWEGDDDLNFIIKELGGKVGEKEYYSSTLEFDYIPIQEEIQFEYIFASESYGNFCPYSCEPGGAFFAVWLTDSVTGEGQNLAIVPGTEDPISLSTIRNSSKSGAFCKSVNPEYFASYYGDNFLGTQDDPAEAPVNYIGLTVPMMSKPVQLVPGRKYHIKLAIVDFCSYSKADASAVFVRGFDYKLDNITFNVQKEIDTCDDFFATITSSLPIDSELSMNIEWYRDNLLIEGEKDIDIKIEEGGKYILKVEFPDIDCEIISEVDVNSLRLDEIKKPDDLIICRNSFEEKTVDLTIAEEYILKGLDKSNYKLAYFNKLNNAEKNINSVKNINNYKIETEVDSVIIYIRVERKGSNCYKIIEFAIRMTEGDAPNFREDEEVCSTYIFPPLEENQYYFSASGGNGVQFMPGDRLEKKGKYNIYILQKNGNEGCYEEVYYSVVVKGEIKAYKLEDVFINCDTYILPSLPENNYYFTQSGGQGEQLKEGEAILKDHQIYIYAQTPDGMCYDETSFYVKYGDCREFPNGISPNGDGVNDSFDLSNYNVFNVKIFNRYGVEVYSYGRGYLDYWKGQDNKGNLLPDGTYFYVVQTSIGTKEGWVQINR